MMMRVLVCPERNVRRLFKRVHRQIEIRIWTNLVTMKTQNNSSRLLRRFLQQIGFIWWRGTLNEFTNVEHADILEGGW
jgi:hypothetical protein